MQRRGCPGSVSCGCRDLGWGSCGPSRRQRRPRQRTTPHGEAGTAGALLPARVPRSPQTQGRSVKTSFGVVLQSSSSLATQHEYRGSHLFRSQVRPLTARPHSGLFTQLNPHKCGTAGRGRNHPEPLVPDSEQYEYGTSPLTLVPAGAT